MVFRVFDDGVGFRYEWPEQANLKDLNISDELTEFALRGGRIGVVDSSVWLKPLRISFQKVEDQRT